VVLMDCGYHADLFQDRAFLQPERDGRGTRVHGDGALTVRRHVCRLMTRGASWTLRRSRRATRSRPWRWTPPCWVSTPRGALSCGKTLDSKP